MTPVQQEMSMQDEIKSMIAELKRQENNRKTVIIQKGQTIGPTELGLWGAYEPTLLPINLEHVHFDYFGHRLNSTVQK